MKILLYNTCYCIGFNAPRKSKYEKLWKYIYSDTTTLKELKAFIKKVNPEVLALTEIDSGSIRAHCTNQPLTIAKVCGFGSVFYRTKYSSALLRGYLPIFRHQCNAILTKAKDSQFSYGFFECAGDLGSKNLYLHCAIHPQIDFFLLHLPLDGAGRAAQLRELSEVIQGCPNEVIVAGDFNIFDGYEEIDAFMRNSNLTPANTQKIPTYPSWKPEKEIDLILKTPGIRVTKFEVLDVHLSDHLPILVDVEV